MTRELYSCGNWRRAAETVLASCSQLRVVQSESCNGSTGTVGVRGRKIGNAGRFRQARHERLLLGIIFDGGLERLIGGEPEILAQGIVIAVDPDRARRAEKTAEAFVGDEVRAVEIVVSDANIHAHDAVAAARRGNQRAKFRDDRAHVQIENAVLDVVGARGLIRARNCQFEARARAVEFILHGRESVVRIGRGGLLRLGQALQRDAAAEPRWQARRTSEKARQQRQTPGKHCKWKFSLRCIAC